MIKNIIGIMLLLISGNLLADKLPITEIVWTPVIGGTTKDHRMFFDNSSRGKINTEERVYGIGTIMLSSKGAYSITTDADPKIRSVVKHVVVECGSGLMGSTGDFYFTESNPNITSKPLHSIKSPAFILISKQSIVFNLICPTII